MTAHDKKSGSTHSINENLNIDEEQLLSHPSYEELQKQLTDAEGKSNEYWERLLRLQAEMDNAKRRAERDVEYAHKFGLEKLTLELLPVIDNLERAITSHLNEESGKGSLLEGVQLTLKSFQTALGKFGVEEINPLGDAFNPELHQAVSTAPLTEEYSKPGIVLNVLQKGYLLNKRLIRPALVVVTK